jgi:hypothetical protein
MSSLNEEMGPSLLRQNRIKIGLAGALVVVLSLTAVGVTLSEGSTGSSLPPNNNLEQTVEEADNAWLAVYSPMASLPDNSCTSPCSPTISQISNSESDESLQIALSQFSSTYGSSTGSSDFEQNAAQSIESSTTSSSSNAGISPNYVADVSSAVLASRNAIVIDDLYGPQLASQILDGANNINSEEQSLWSDGTGNCVSEDCTVTGAAGAVITAFVSESVSGSSATVIADETTWQDDGSNFVLGQPIRWKRIQNQIVATDSLQLSTTGSWMVTSHSITFTNGTGP